MPECYSYASFGYCDDKYCQDQHIDPADKIQDCQWYNRGFCKNGTMCKYRHRKKIMCMNYLVGFCPEGSACKFTHPPWDLPPTDVANIRCFKCLGMGHKANACPNDLNKKASRSNTTTFSGSLIAKPNPSPTQFDVSRLVDELLHRAKNRNSITSPPPLHKASVKHNVGSFESPNSRNFSHITCYRCGRKGHYANYCSDGGGAFLSPFRASSGW